MIIKWIAPIVCFVHFDSVQIYKTLALGETPKTPLSFTNDHTKKRMEMIYMAQQRVYVRSTVLRDVVGRVDYISSPSRQENLVTVHASYDTEAEPEFWKELAQQCCEMNEQYGDGKRKTVEGREWHGDLDNRLYNQIEPELLASRISQELKKITGTDNVVALHWNKSKTNYHWHAVVSECKYINEEREGAVLTRNTYFNQMGQRSTKKACTNDKGELLEGCSFLKKGERKKTYKKFGKKEDLRRKQITLNIKEAVSKVENDCLNEDKYVVANTSKDATNHVASQHVGNKVQGKQKDKIIKKNELIRKLNQSIDEVVNDDEMTSGEKDLIAAKFKDIKNEMKDYAINNDYRKWDELASEGAEIIKESARELSNSANGLAQIENIRERLDKAIAKGDTQAIIDLMVQMKRLNIEYNNKLQAQRRRYVKAQNKLEETNKSYSDALTKLNKNRSEINENEAFIKDNSGIISRRINLSRIEEKENKNKMLKEENISIENQLSEIEIEKTHFQKLVTNLKKRLNRFMEIIQSTNQGVEKVKSYFLGTLKYGAFKWMYEEASKEGFKSDINFSEKRIEYRELRRNERRKKKEIENKEIENKTIEVQATLDRVGVEYKLNDKLDEIALRAYDRSDEKASPEEIDRMVDLIAKDAKDMLNIANVRNPFLIGDIVKGARKSLNDGFNELEVRHMYQLVWKVENDKLEIVPYFNNRQIEQIKEWINEGLDIDYITEYKVHEEQFVEIKESDRPTKTAMNKSFDERMKNAKSKTKRQAENKSEKRIKKVVREDGLER